MERQLQEVIVAATRRRESNQRVPIGIAAFSADDAEKAGVTDGQSLAGLVPGLLFNRQSNTSIPFLRGVGTPVGQSGDEPSVALYIDSVYVPAGSVGQRTDRGLDGDREHQAGAAAPGEHLDNLGLIHMNGRAQDPTIRDGRPRSRSLEPSRP